MDRITFSMSTTYQTEKAIFAFLRSSAFKANTAHIRYDTQRGLPDMENVEEYPLIIEGYLDRIPVELRIFCVTAGYSGTGPRSLHDILKVAGFTVDSKFIFTSAWEVNNKIDFTCTINGRMINNLG